MSEEIDPPLSPWIFRVLGSFLPAAWLAWTNQRELQENPWLLFLALPLVGLLMGFVSVIQALWARWQPAIVDWCDLRLRALWSRSHARYLDYIQIRFRDFDVKGLSSTGPHTLHLNDVFIDLRVDARPPHEASPDPLHRHEEAPEGPANLWAHLETGANLAILGSPGSGKTTLMKHAALILSGPKSRCREVSAPPLVPVLLFLRDLTGPILSSDDAGFTLEDAAATAIRAHREECEGWLRLQLQKGRCLILLDGLDEVSTPKAREHISVWVEQQITRYSKNRFILTSRPFGYLDNPITGVSVLTVCPFRREQIEAFIDGWYLANEIKASQLDDEGVRIKAAEGANDLLERLESNTDLRQLAVNPLLLTLIASVHRYRSSLPGRRVELYKEICDVFLGKRQQARGIEQDLTPQQKQLVLQPLAWHMMSERTRTVNASEAATVVSAVLERVSQDADPHTFLEMVQDVSGLLIEKEAGTWAFSHKTFQEYLAAVHAHERGSGGVLMSHVEDDWWHESILLYVAQGDATAIVKACLEVDPPPLSALVLATRCEREARELHPAQRHSLHRILEADLESSDAERRMLAARCRLELRLRGFSPIDDDVWMDDSLITNAEYNLFVLEEREHGRIRAPFTWGEHEPRVNARQPVRGVRFADAKDFASWLTDRGHGEWTYRLPHLDEWEVALPVQRDEHQAAPSGHWAQSSAGGVGIVYPAHGERELSVRLAENQLLDDLIWAHDLSERDRQLAADFGLDVSDWTQQIGRIQNLKLHLESGEFRKTTRLAKMAIEHVFLSDFAPFYRSLWFLWGALIWLVRGAVTSTLRFLTWPFHLIDNERRTQWIRNARETLFFWGLKYINPLLSWIMRPLTHMIAKVFYESARQKASDLGLEPEDLKAPVTEEEVSGLLAEFSLAAAAQFAFEILNEIGGPLYISGEPWSELTSTDSVDLSLSQAIGLLNERHKSSNQPSTDQTIWLCKFIRVRLVLLSTQRLQYLVYQLLKQQDVEQASANDVLDTYITAWLECVTLQERLQGKKLAWEGIRLAREPS